MKKARKKAYWFSIAALILGTIFMAIGLYHITTGPDTMTIYMIWTGLAFFSWFAALMFAARMFALRTKESEEIIKRLEEKLGNLEKAPEEKHEGGPQ
jgi:hypothetical protein